MAIKVDLEKAYDRLEWDYIEETLCAVGLPVKIIARIMYCVRSVSAQISWNGDLSDSFCPSRGIRQGDPLSPYLFVLCMDRLSQAIQSSVMAGRWRPIHLTRNGPPLSHLFFADDMVLFAEATMEQVGVIRGILNGFCQASGHKVSISKTQIFFSRNCDMASKSLIARNFGFEVVEDLGKYLGVSLLHKRVTHATYAYVLDAMRARLSGWAAQSLSLAGRITLAKSVLQSIPTYVMQATSLTKGICQEMEKLIRKFVWGGSDERTGIALLPWDTVQRIPAQGGLGFKDLHIQNKAFLVKIGYSLVTNNDRLWVQVLKSKYGWNEVLPLDIKHSPCSRLWTGISNIWEALQECIRWEIRDGSSTDFWYDQWLGEEGRLAFACLLSTSPRPMPVVDMVLPMELVERIATVRPPCGDAGADKPVWRYGSKHQFTMCSTYEAIADGVGPQEGGEWRKIRKLLVPQRIRVFFWIVFHDRLLTNVERYRRHITGNNLCGICGACPESMDHVLRSCAMVRNVWLRFAITCWLIWKRRCCLVLGTGETFNDDILVHVNRMVEGCKRAFIANQRAPSRSIVQSCWCTPSLGWIKLNVDSSVSTRDYRAGVGGVLRNDRGRWLLGFSRFLGHCDSLLAELWAIHDGLLHAWDSGYARVELESDCLEAVRIINSESRALEGSALVSSFVGVISRDWTVTVTHVGRGRNRVADALAARGRDLGAGGMLFLAPPNALVSLIEEEALGSTSAVGESIGVGTNRLGIG
ncbi:hypothetical protein GQ457_06G005280 [Hibiscus cannabinus]